MFTVVREKILVFVYRGIMIYYEKVEKSERKPSQGGGGGVMRGSTYY